MATMDEEKKGKQEEKAMVADVCFFVLVLLPRSQIVSLLAFTWEVIQLDEALTSASVSDHVFQALKN